MIEDRPAVRLELDSSPETLTLVRGALGAVAEVLALDPELLDDLKTAVSEACNNVVMHAYDGVAGPAHRGALRRRRRHRGARARQRQRHPAVGTNRRPYAGRGAADHSRARPGLRVPPGARRAGPRCGCRSPAGGRGWRCSRLLASPPPRTAGSTGCRATPSYPCRRSASSVPSSGGWRRALAARARFSLDRFSDVYLITDAIAAHAARVSGGPADRLRACHQLPAPRADDRPFSPRHRIRAA